MKRRLLALLATFLCLPLVAQDQRARPKILGIARVNLYSTNMAAARDFYSKSISRTDPCSWCEKRPREAELILLNGEQIVRVSMTTTPTPSSLLAEVAFFTNDLAAMKQFLAANHIAFSEAKGASKITVKDPEGRDIAFVNPLQASPDSVLNASKLRLIHAGFIVRDRPATEHFYKDILGFRPYWHGGMKDDQTDWVSMQVPDGTDWLEFMVNVRGDPDQRLRGIMNHIAIGVPDIRAAEKKLQENGVQLTEEAKIGRDGKWQLNLYDPDDTRIEFMEFTPVEKPCCSEFTGPHPKP